MSEKKETAEMEDLETEATQAAEAVEEQEKTEKTMEGESAEEEKEGQDAEKWKQQAEENYQRFLRAQADFDNFRKRTRKEKEEWMQYASLPLVESLLPAIDNLERAISSSQDSQNFESLIKGVEMVYRQIKEILSKEGLQPIEALGQPFDPNCHQAVMQEESKEHEPGTVIAELQKGYRFKDKVVRPSMVKVSS